MNKILDASFIRDPLIFVLGLCPLLVGTDTLQKGMWLGLACMAVIICGSVVVGMIRNIMPCELRLISVLIISTCLVSVFNLLAQVWIYDISMQLGIYLPLVAINCLVLAFIENHSFQLNVFDIMIKSVRLGMLIFVILFLAGTVREYSGLYLLRQPFGALMLMALVVAIINRLGPDFNNGPHPDLS